jgi:predicted acylesterase/phospholipase RssA
MVETRTANAPLRVLSIDGGGIRGIIPAMLLERIEAATGRPIARQFDVIVGTSTGGIMALLLTVPGPDGAPRYTAAHITELYTQHGRDLFSAPPGYGQGRPPGTFPRYPAESVTATLNPYFGEVTLSQALTHVVVSAYDLETCRPAVFQYPLSRPDPDFYMRDLARATSAFPGLFPAAEICSVEQTVTRRLIDGGVMSANPAALAAACARVYAWDTPIWLVSLGTGVHEVPAPWPDAQEWGFVQWATDGRLVESMFSGASYSADLEAACWPNLSYLRFQVRLPKEHAGTDDATAANISGLKAIVEAQFTEPSRHEGFDGFGDWPSSLDLVVRLLTETDRTTAPAG